MNEKSFLEMLGALTLAALIILFIYWIGWIFFLIIFWGVFVRGIYSSVHEALITKKYFSSILPILFCSFFSGILFWMGVGSLSDLVLHALVGTMVGHSLIVVCISIIFSKILNK